MFGAGNHDIPELKSPNNKTDTNLSMHVIWAIKRDPRTISWFVCWKKNYEKEKKVTCIPKFPATWLCYVLTEQRDFSYRESLSILNLDTLEYRRVSCDLTWYYKKYIII